MKYTRLLALASLFLLIPGCGFKCNKRSCCPMTSCYKTQPACATPCAQTAETIVNEGPVIIEAPAAIEAGMEAGVEQPVVMPSEEIEEYEDIDELPEATEAEKIISDKEALEEPAEEELEEIAETN